MTLPADLAVHRIHGDVVRPGDVLIVRVAATLTRQEVEDCAKLIQSRLTDVQVLVVNAEQVLVYRPKQEGVTS